MRLLVTIYLLLLVLAIAAVAQQPGPVSPFMDGISQLRAPQGSQGVLLRGAGAGGGSIDLGNADAATWMISQQILSNGGFPWVPGTSSASNITGPIGMGLLRTNQHSGHAASLTAATAATGYLMPTYPRLFTDGDPKFASHDPMFLELMSSATGSASYAAFVQTHFWDKLTAGTYGELNDQDAADWVAALMTGRASIIEIVPWDMSATAIAAHLAGETAIRNAFMAGIEDGLEATTTADNDYDVIGLAGAIWASAMTGVGLDPTTGIHAAANSTADLVARLLACQRASDGAFLRSADPVVCDPMILANGDAQVTAYAILALQAFDPVTYKPQIARAVAFLRSLQQPSGQILVNPTAPPSEGGSTEVHGEAMHALALSAPDVVYVDDDWAAVAIGADPDGAGPALRKGYDAFAAIGDAIDVVATGGTVNIAAGTYEEQLEITRNMDLVGAGTGVTIVRSPATLTKSFLTGTNTNKPVVYIHDAADVSIKSLTVDGFGRGNTNSRFSGIAFFQAGGSVNECSIVNVRDTPFSGAQHGVALYAYSVGNLARTLVVTDNSITGFQKNGMAIIGGDLTATVTGNIVTGVGPTGVTAQNGIQISGGAIASVSDNVVSDISWTGTQWTASGILISGAGATTAVGANNVTDCQTGLYWYMCSGGINGNTIVASGAGVGRVDAIYGMIVDPSLTPPVQPSPVDGGISSFTGRNRLSKTLGTYTVSVSGNYLRGDGNHGYGVYFYAFDGEILNASVTNNDVLMWDYGMIFSAGTTGVLNVTACSGNDLAGNKTSGMYSDITAITITAENNWWGAPSGPGGVGSGSGDAVTAYIDFDPWSGAGQTANVGAMGIAYAIDASDNGVADMTVTLATLPESGGAINARIHTSNPGPHPDPLSTAMLYLEIFSDLPNYAFDATVVLDLTALGISNFDANTVIVYFNTTTNQWVLLDGVYNSTANTYTFTTNHFTLFAFLDGAATISGYHNTALTAYDLFLTSDPAVTSSGIIYPNDNWALPAVLPAGYTNPLHDWGYTGAQPVALYVVPVTTAQFGSSAINLQWTDGVLGSASIDYAGSIYANANPSLPTAYATSNTLGSTNSLALNAALLNQNFDGALVTGDYIAKLNLSLLHPGSSQVDFVGADLRHFETGSAFTYVWSSTTQALIKAYLGDVANATNESSGDGAIDLSDLAIWSASYWSGVPGGTGMSAYKVKFDIGPTTTNYIDGLPAVDGRIDFEDLMIFAINYGLSANNSLPRAAHAAERIGLAIGEMSDDAGIRAVTIATTNDPVDLRGISLVLEGSFGELLSAEYAGSSEDVVVFHRRDDGMVTIDLAALGGGTGIRRAGDLVTLRFAGAAEIRRIQGLARDSRNNSITVARGELPLASGITLSQNYPNPFNPVTRIGFALPERARISLDIYNALGQHVRTLLRAELSEGIHTATFDGMDARGRTLPSGLYFYRLTAGDTMLQKTMILNK